jgi:hypothetical protein
LTGFKSARRLFGPSGGLRGGPAAVPRRGIVLILRAMLDPGRAALVRAWAVLDGPSRRSWSIVGLKPRGLLGGGAVRRVGGGGGGAGGWAGRQRGGWRRGAAAAEAGGAVLVFVAGDGKAEAEAEEEVDLPGKASEKFF